MCWVFYVSFILPTMMNFESCPIQNLQKLSICYFSGTEHASQEEISQWVKKELEGGWQSKG